MNTAVVRVRFSSPAAAQSAGLALAPDNGSHLKWSVDGAVLVLEASADTTLGLVRTLDDVLGCIRALGVA